MSSSAPISNPAILSVTSSLAVNISIGSVLFPAARKRRQTSKPSISGKIRSSTTRSGANRSFLRRASLPLAAAVTSNPLWVKPFLRKPVIFGSSSTINILLIASSLAACVLLWGSLCGAACITEKKIRSSCHMSAKKIRVTHLPLLIKERFSLTRRFISAVKCSFFLALHHHLHVYFPLYAGGSNCFLTILFHNYFRELSTWQ